jgi:hypothetical protein
VPPCLGLHQDALNVVVLLELASKRVIATFISMRQLKLSETPYKLATKYFLLFGLTMKMDVAMESGRYLFVSFLTCKPGPSGGQAGVLRHS